MGEIYLNMTEKFCLKWNDFQPNVTSAFSQLRNKTNFQDVTLVSDDHKQISAHRVVLISCSGYFNNILSENNHSHPLLCLDGINFKELHNVLDYIYKGEVSIYQKDLERFLQIAHKLQLQGLLSSEKHEKKEKADDYQAIAEIAESAKMDVTKQTPEKIISMNSEDFQSIEELDTYIEQQILKTEVGSKCNICDKSSKKRSNLKEHVEMMHIKGLTFDCFCGKTFTSR